MNEIKEAGPPEEEGHKLGRREAIKVGAAVAGGLALGLTYVKPGMRTVGVKEVYAETTIVNPPRLGIGGCTPGFWGGGPVNREGRGYELWDEPPTDPDWSDPPGGLEWPYSLVPVPRDVQPFYASQRFSLFFPGWPRFTTQHSEADGGEGLRLDDFVPKTPPPPPNTQAERLARACVAAYLNASWFGGPDIGGNFYYSKAEILAMWNAAVAEGLAAGGDLAAENGDLFNDYADLLDAENNGACAS